IPYKQAVIPYLQEIDEAARAIGAVNTIVNRGGRLIGFNTDFSGLRELLLKNGMDLQGKKVLILGSGGTSKTALAVAKSMGAAEVLRLSRREGTADCTYEQALRDHTDAQFLINTTPCGMFPKIGEMPVDPLAFPALCGVADAVYNPLSSALVVRAREGGVPAIGGLYMLVAQAVFAAEKFTGRTFPKSEIDRVYAELLREKQNLVLIGMPGCGKTTIGRSVAEKTGRRFFDTDEEIVKETGVPIPVLFERYGEPGFRKIEQQVIRRVAAEQSAVVATGGGAVLQHENMALLKENGKVLFLDRPLDQLAVTSDRPLSSNREALAQRFREREHLYRAEADLVADASHDLQTNLQEVLTLENSGFKRS
ncbi:MAG: AAA family ATPase, partial [Clostridia bacterium]|nr:AAA family ATPase [Clostridia bacterium]